MNLSRLILRVLLGRRLPIASGELRLRGPRAPVTIRRDRYGIPHIDAANESDAFFAVGFCQGQDRGGQLEFLWRVGRGRLAEWVGPDGLGADRMSRRIGFRRCAEKQLGVLSPPAREQLSAYAAGVTAGSREGLTNKPHEFAILGGEPSAWDAADVLANLKLQSFSLPSNWDVELARLRILLADGPAALLALDPSPDEQPPLDAPADAAGAAATVARAAVLAALCADVAALQSYVPRGGGSNNWVIDGSRTATGKPLLASDPHLAPSAPPPWYISHIRTPDWEAMGASLSGSPGYAIGHNGFAAWGVTAGLTDNTDLFIESLGADGTSVKEADGSYTPCEVVREIIHVKGQPDTVEDVVITPRGPLISPLLTDIPLAVSLRGVWQQALPIKGFLDVPRARSFEEFRTAFSEWPILPLNVVYADITGKTGWVLVGQIPVRAGGAGLVPRPADRPDTGWTGLLPHEDMPFVENPERGFWATANNPPFQEGRGAEEQNNGIARTLGADYCDPYRVRGILDALAARAQWTVEDCLTLQRDVRSLPWTDMRDIVLSLVPADADARQAIDLLRDWDGEVGSESPAACIFELFVAEMCVRVARVKAPKSWLAVVGETGLGEGSLSLFADRRVAHLIRLLRTQPDGWFASWPGELLDALAMVVRKLRREVGPGSAFWAWGHLRRLRLDHPLFGKHRWLGPAFDIGPVPCGGDCNTISQAGARPAHPTDFTHNMCNLRTVFDLSDLGKSRFVLCGGQSGNPCSPHFQDQFPLWREGEAIAVPWEQAAVIREAAHTLRLLPG
jgi:penicillin amidase